MELGRELLLGKGMEESFEGWEEGNRLVKVNGRYLNGNIGKGCFK